MMAPRTSLVALAALVTVLAVGALASAAPDDRTATEDALREVERSPKKDVAAEMTARSRAALERAAKLRASGDETHARLAEGLAKTWAEAARDVLRAVDIEEKSQATRRAATFALRHQYSSRQAFYLPNPDRARGAFRSVLTSSQVRIDGVQHNVELLLLTERLLRE